MSCAFLEGEAGLCLYLRARKQVIKLYANSVLILISLALTIHVHERLTPLSPLRIISFQ